MLDIDDVRGKRRISTRLHGEVTIGEEQAIAALEVMSRFAANPKWLVYLPPTMSPVATTTRTRPGAWRTAFARSSPRTSSAPAKASPLTPRRPK